ncbi:MAG: MATE family efflux transporter [Myxococcota bacterium]|nr:MATE family efflux transporter [Myxococcota bacterium]
MSLSTDTSTRIGTTPGASGSLREVWILAYPVVLTQLSATLMGVIDSAMVGRLGPAELAAVGFGSIWLWTLFSLFYGTASAVQTFVAQYDGAGEAERCGAWAWRGFWVVVPAAALAAAILLPSLDGLLARLGTSAELQRLAADYASARLPGEVGFAAWMVFNSFFRGIGDTRTPMVVTICVNVLNAALDYGLIFGAFGLPAMGVTGAATATAIAMWTGAAVLFLAFRRRRLRERFQTRLTFPRARHARRFLRLGAPMGGQWFLGMTSFAVFTTVVARMGDSSMAASQAFVMLLSLSFMQAIGISIAAQTLVGRYKGAGDPEAARRSYASSLGLGVSVATVVAVLFVAAPGALLGIFTDDPTVVALGRPLLLVGALFQLCDAVAIISQGALRGAGDTRWPFAVETALGWLVFVPLAYGLGVTLELGLTGAWTGGLIAIALQAAVLAHRFHQGPWETLQI